MEKKFASSTLWTTYSQVNTVMKQKYSFSLKSYQRVQAFIKSFDVDIKTKAPIFSKVSQSLIFYYMFLIFIRYTYFLHILFNDQINTLLYDTIHFILIQEELDSFVSDGNINTSYQRVCKAEVLLAFFGGLRKTEAEALKLEDIISSSDGVHVTHSRAKQRSDQLCSKFLVPRWRDYIKYTVP